MAYDEDLAHRVRAAISQALPEALPGQVTERAMFGGLGFMVDGHMAVAVNGSGGMMVHVDPGDGQRWIDEGDDGVEAMVMRGRPMSGWVHLDVPPDDAVEAGNSGTTSRAAADGREPASGSEEDPVVARWVGRGVAYVRTLPPKTSKPTTARRR